MREEFIKQFKNPDMDKYSLPFWSWNEKLDRDELSRQLKGMKQAGVGGFFIHPRDGLETEYLGTEWMECVKAVVAEAKELGLSAWLYDEDRWPSGTAGGRVPALGDAYRCKGLTLDVLGAAEYQSVYEQEIKNCKNFTDSRNGILAVYAVKEEAEKIISLRRLTMSGEELFKESEKLLVVRLEVSAPSEWFNHEAPPDNLNPDCVKKFIEETHERYKAIVGDEFGKTIPGIFTDESSLHDRHAYFGETRSWIPWTYCYGEYFKNQMGYDFFDVLPYFYFQGEKSEKTRHDYWYTITKRYGESYYKTIGEWCKENNLLFTGHFLQEEKMGLYVRVNGAIMPNYQYQQVPGIDLLCEQTNEYITVKQCTSVAHQLGKKQVLTETYGCTGWDFTFEGQKWLGDWQYVLGVNRRCQHLALYSLRGCRKRDYPPSFNYNNNWWPDNRWVDDYFARISVVTEQGKPVRNILLLHPVTTVWSRLGASPYGNPSRNKERDVPALNEYGARYNELIEYMERMHLDCDLGDEMLMEQYGEIKDGKFQIGEASYSVVILPPDMENLLTETCKKLLEYMDKGGFVCAVKPLPKMQDGSRTIPEYVEKVTSHNHLILMESKEELMQYLEPYRTIHITCTQGQECMDVLYQLRKSEEGYFLFLVNNNRNKDINVMVSLPFPAIPEALELESGEIHQVMVYENSAEGIRLPVHLQRTGSAAYYLKPSRARTTKVSETCEYVLSHPNVLPLDRCCYRLDRKEWSEPMEVWQAQMEIRKYLGMKQINHNGLEQRYRWVEKTHPEDGHQVELSFLFEAEAQFSNVFLGAERLEEFTVTSDGAVVESENYGWFLDREFKTMELPSVLPGKNRLVLSCDYKNNSELENIYIIGAFGVSESRSLIALPKRLTVGDWTTQGLKHYCGSVTWRFDYVSSGNSRETIIKLPEIYAVCVKLRINGNEKVRLWNFSEDMTVGSWLKPGTNTVEIEVVGSPRNMMGPFHLKEKPYHTHDASFCPEPEDYSEEYLLTPYGIMAEIIIIEIE